jgi:branched-chain amino acid transport system permease protein
VTGAALGGLGLMLLPVMQADHPDVAGLIFAIIGFGAVLLGRDPNGLANHMFRISRWVWAWAIEKIRENLPDLPGAPRSRWAAGADALDDLDDLDDRDEFDDSDDSDQTREVPAHVAP